MLVVSVPVLLASGLESGGDKADNFDPNLSCRLDQSSNYKMTGAYLLSPTTVCLDVDGAFM